jgi:hypothetical protein
MLGMLDDCVACGRWQNCRKSLPKLKRDSLRHRFCWAVGHQTVMKVGATPEQIDAIRRILQSTSHYDVLQVPAGDVSVSELRKGEPAPSSSPLRSYEPQRIGGSR